MPVRAIAISLELVLLIGLLLSLLTGAGLALFDLGIRLKYRQAVAVALIALGSLLVIFFIAHLISFYPAAG